MTAPATPPRPEPPAAAHYTDGQLTLWHGDALTVLRTLPDESVNCIATSPPYFWMRDYGADGQYGLEATPGEYIDVMVGVLTEARRVLAADGTLWLNLGDAYSQRKAIWPSSHQETRGRDADRPKWRDLRARGLARMSAENVIDGRAIAEKSLMMLPERIVIALERAGWIIRNKVVWAKTFTRPDSVADRFAARWEPLYLLVKSPRYWFDQTVVDTYGDVWTLPASNYAGKHSATFPAALVERCVLAGCRPGGVVLDPFSGAGTTGLVALRHGRRYIGVDLSRACLDDSLRRLGQTQLGGVA